MLGALATAHALGIPLELIAATLPDIAPAPGRFQALDEGQPFTVLVDYAHTPDSLENVLSAARTLADGRLLSVFGCGGDRDRGKRPQMGRISAELADLTIVTSDNPRSEEPAAILEEILAGIDGSSAVEAIVERAAAIERAIALASPGDVVVIAGKGHEQGQEFADGPQGPFRRRAGRPCRAACPRMNGWSAATLAEAADARLLGGPRADGGPKRIVIDSRGAGPGDLFVGLRGANTDGGRFAADALAAGAWGVLASSAHLEPLAYAGAGALLAAEDPLVSLGLLARAWRRELTAKVVAITGSSGKTSTKDILAALLARALATVASRQNRNTEIGLPLTILEAPAGTQALVLELAMRAPGQIAELTAICEPDVGVIVNVGPAHLERLGSLEAIATAKAELIAGLRPGASAVLPAREPLLEPHLREDIEVIRFGAGGAVSVLAAGDDGVTIALGGRRVRLEPGFRSAHLLDDLCAALAAARRSASRSPTGHSRLPSPHSAASDLRCPAACSSSTTATTPTRCRCAPRCRSSP